MKKYFVSYSTAEFLSNQRRLEESAKSIGGFDEVISWNQDRIKQTDFYQKHKNILEQKRGDSVTGAWLWKPFIILDQLKKANTSDFVVYWDVGRPGAGFQFQHNVQPLLDWCIKNNNGILPGIPIPRWGPNKQWTKRDCFILMDCDEEKYKEHCQIQATYSVWQKNYVSLKFVSDWLKFGTDYRIITDAPNTCGRENSPEFKTHRHDQSILTNLVIKENLRCYENPKLPERLIDKNMNSLINVLCTPEWIFLLHLRTARLRGYVEKKRSSTSIFGKPIIFFMDLLRERINSLR